MLPHAVKSPKPEYTTPLGMNYVNSFNANDAGYFDDLNLQIAWRCTGKNGWVFPEEAAPSAFVFAKTIHMHAWQCEHLRHE